MRVRIKFEKKQPVQYLGHLDIMRFFQRCFNRAEVQMEYSGGYNPHQKMSFAQPLGVGILSNGEYLDAEIADGQDLARICESLNRVCGDGFSVASVREVKEGAKKAMAALAFAAYHVDLRPLFDAGCEMIQSAITDLLAKEQIQVMKTTKSGTKEVDIRPQIVRVEYKDGILSMLVTAGSNNNLKPDTLLSELLDKTTVEYQRERITIIRDELFAEGMIPLESFQTVI